jgi:putative glutamine amidotransferase
MSAIRKFKHAALVACCLFAAASAFTGCQTRPPNKVKVVALADGCVTNGFVMARSTNSDALSAAGYIPVLIPRISDTNLLAQAMDRVDALLLTGGIKGQDYPNRIEFEKLLMRMAIERGLPILGFCHGHQCINLYFGGTLMPVPKDSSPSIVHRGKDPPYVKDCFHMINIKPGSRLAEGFGTTRMEVNTSHTMCVKDVGEGLEVTARSDDGVVEAIEHRTLPITGFQFHPERIFRRDPRYLRIIVDALERGTSKGK